MPVSLAIAIGLPLLLLGLPAVYTRQMRHAGILGVIGFILFFLACVLFGGSSGLSDIVLIPRDLSPGGVSSSMLAEDVFFIAQGRSNQEIAELLDLTLKTVRNYVSNIFNKLQVMDRAQAVIRAREVGLG